MRCLLTSAFAVLLDWSPEDWTLHSRVATVSELGYEKVSETYLSPPMPLAPGQMIYTEPERTSVKMPEGKYAVLEVHGDIVKGGPKLEDTTSVPLSDVYDHHWILLMKDTQNPICGAGINFEFGIGAEARATPTVYPEGYGKVIEAGSEWFANIHLLHTVNLTGEPHVNVKECNECWYAPGKGSQCTPENNGSFACCGDSCDITDNGNCFCPAEKGPAVTYYLKYTVTYTTDWDKVTPVTNAVLATPNCEPFYNVYRNDTQPFSLSSHSFPVPFDVDLVYAQGHQHSGSLNISLLHNGKVICTSYPQYGKSAGVLMDELGYVVKISRCEQQRVPLRKGDILQVDSWYFVGSEDSRLAPHVGGTHLNVMGYMIMAFTAPSGPFNNQSVPALMSQAWLDGIVSQAWLPLVALVLS